MTDLERNVYVTKLNAMLKKMKGLFSETYIRAIEQMKDAIQAGADFSWDDYKQQSLAIDKIIDVLLGNTDTLLVNSVNFGYESGIENAVNGVNTQIDKYSHNVTKIRKKDLRYMIMSAQDIDRGGVAYCEKNKELATELSKRVWNLKEGVKDELTIIIKNSILMGKGVNATKLEVVKYLNNPKLLTTHVLNKDGKLVMTEEAKNLHPGQGVYRDPLKNAERMLRTETLSAYRTAEQDTYEQTDLILGYEIKLSGNHTTKTPNGGFKKLKDICDALQGKYPKTFVWKGWHPNCRCVMLPIYLSDEQLEDYFKAKHEKKLDEFNKKNQISVFPKNFNDWVQTNSQRILDAQNAKNNSLPQWVEDNKKELNLPKQLPAHKSSKALPAYLSSSSQSPKLGYIAKAGLIAPASKKFEIDDLKKNAQKVFSDFLKKNGLPDSKLEFKTKTQYDGSIEFIIKDNNLTIEQNIKGNSSELMTFSIAKELQNNGLSKLLMKELMNNWRLNNIDRIELNAIGGYEPYTKISFNGSYTWAKYGFFANNGIEIVNELKNCPKYKNLLDEYFKNNDMSKPFDINILINKFGKKDIQNYFYQNNICWNGFLDTKNKEQINIFNNYVCN